MDYVEIITWQLPLIVAYLLRKFATMAPVEGKSFVIVMKIKRK